MNATWASCPVLTGKPVKVTDGEAAGSLAGLDEIRLFKHSGCFFFFFLKLRCVLASFLSWSVQFVEGLGFQLTISLAAQKTSADWPQAVHPALAAWSARVYPLVNEGNQVWLNQCNPFIPMEGDATR